MKKLSLFAVILALGTMCFTGCDMSDTTSSNNAVPDTQSIIAQDESENEVTPTPCPDDNCEGQRMPFRKPSFKFRVPGGKQGKKGRDKFRRRHRKPAPAPEPKPEVPETPEEN